MQGSVWDVNSVTMETNILYTYFPVLYAIFPGGSVWGVNSVTMETNILYTYFPVLYVIFPGGSVWGVNSVTMETNIVYTYFPVLYVIFPGGSVWGVNVLFTATVTKLKDPYFTISWISASNGRCPISCSTRNTEFTHWNI